MVLPFELIYFLLLVTFVITLLIIIKVIFGQINKDDGHKFINGMRAGNAQIIGQKEIQNDYFTIACDDNSLLAAIADGLTEKKTGKFASVISMVTLKENYVNGVHRAKGIPGFFKSSFEIIQRRISDNTYGNKMGATIIAVIVKDKRLYFASIGNCALFLYRNGELVTVNEIINSESEIKRISIRKKDVAMLCSKGIYEGLTEMEILSELARKNHPYEKCQNLVTRIHRKSRIYQDNATIIILENMV